MSNVRDLIRATRKDISRANRKNFLLFGLPGLCWWLFIAYLALVGLNANLFGGDIIIENAFEAGEAWLMGLGMIIPLIIALAIGVAMFPYILLVIALVVYVCIPLGVLAIIVTVPIDFFQSGTFILDNWILFVMGIMFILSVIGALSEDFPWFEFEGTGLDLESCCDLCDVDYLCDSCCEEECFTDGILLVIRVLLNIVAGFIIFWIVNLKETESDRRYLKSLKK